jgi:hypothetical protein
MPAGHVAGLKTRAGYAAKFPELSAREIRMIPGDRTIDQADENVRSTASQFHEMRQFD